MMHHCSKLWRAAARLCLDCFITVMKWRVIYVMNRFNCYVRNKLKSSLFCEVIYTKKPKHLKNKPVHKVTSFGPTRVLHKEIQH